MIRNVNLILHRYANASPKKCNGSVGTDVVPLRFLALYTTLGPKEEKAEEDNDEMRNANTKYIEYEFTHAKNRQRQQSENIIIQ